MLRLAVIALLLANAGYYAYTQGWLRSAGLVTPEQAEPQRLQQQIRPETLKVLRAQGRRRPHRLPPRRQTPPHRPLPPRQPHRPMRANACKRAFLTTSRPPPCAPLLPRCPPAAGAWSPRPSPGAG